MSVYDDLKALRDTLDRKPVFATPGHRTFTIRRPQWVANDNKTVYTSDDICGGPAIIEKRRNKWRLRMPKCQFRVTLDTAEHAMELAYIGHCTIVNDYLESI